MQMTAAALPPGVPVFMAVGTADALAGAAEASIFNRAPRHPHSQYLSVGAARLGLTKVIGAQFIDWLRLVGR